jgi:hypothetical protein
VQQFLLVFILKTLEYLTAAGLALRTPRSPSTHAFAEPLVSVPKARGNGTPPRVPPPRRGACALALLAAAPASASRDLRPLRAGFVVRGRVWCDNCRAGFETPASTYIAGETPHHPLPLSRMTCLCYSCACLNSDELISPSTFWIWPCTH